MDDTILANQAVDRCGGDPVLIRGLFAHDPYSADELHEMASWSTEAWLVHAESLRIEVECGHALSVIGDDNE